MERQPPPKTGASSLLGEDDTLMVMPGDAEAPMPGQDLDAAVADELLGDLSALPPHLRGPQASPSPPPPSPWGRIVGGTAAVLALAGIGVLAWGKMNAPETPAVATAAATAPTASVEPKADGPTASLPGVQRAKDWELIAEGLSEVERHVRRAGLAFPDFRSAPQPAVEPVAEGQAEGGVAALPKPAAPDPEMRARWTKWQRDWAADLDYAQKNMPPANQIDRSLLGAHAAVMTAISSARQVPAMPPTDGQGEKFTAQVQPALSAARRAVDAARP